MAASMLAATATFFIIFSISKTYESDVIQKTVCAIRAPNEKNTVLTSMISITSMIGRDTTPIVVAQDSYFYRGGPRRKR